jgi:hypothetical protein
MGLPGVSPTFCVFIAKRIAQPWGQATVPQPWGQDTVPQASSHLMCKLFSQIFCFDMFIAAIVS